VLNLLGQRLKRTDLVDRGLQSLGIRADWSAVWRELFRVLRAKVPELVDEAGQVRSGPSRIWRFSSCSRSSTRRRSSTAAGAASISSSLALGSNFAVAVVVTRTRPP
jgi:hypothetical protein